MKLSEAVRGLKYLSNGFWDTEIETVLVAFIALHGGTLSCCSACTDREETRTQNKYVPNESAPYNRAIAESKSNWYENGVDVIVFPEWDTAHADRLVGICDLIDELVEEQAEAQDCCGDRNDKWAAHAAYDFTVKYMMESIVKREQE